MYNKMDKRALKYMLVRDVIGSIMLLLLWINISNVFEVDGFERFAILGGVIAIGIFCCMLSYYNYKYYGYYYNKEEISVRQGVIFRNEDFMPFSRIQQIEIDANFIERALGIATITFTNAGSKFKIKYLDYDEAKELRSKLIGMIENDDK